MSGRHTRIASRMRRVSDGRPQQKRAPAIPAPVLDRSVMEFLAQSDVPLSAYDLVALFRERGRHMAGPSIYRSLDRLYARQLIEKVEMLSAFRIRDVPQAILMICVACGRTRPLSVPALQEALAQSVASVGFVPRTIALEVAGLCAHCRTQEES